MTNHLLVELSASQLVHEDIAADLTCISKVPSRKLPTQGAASCIIKQVPVSTLKLWCHGTGPV